MAPSESQLKIRLPCDIKAWLDRQSKYNSSSLTSEIIRALRERMERVTAQPPAPKAE
ncbi:DNA-binding protein [Xanthobacter autotrophicus]|uniref:DNA-binding protein n=1 Tax=Xanthobacter autotrophicus TaxID=280 RepID=UPI00372C9E50